MARVRMNRKEFLTGLGVAAAACLPRPAAAATAQTGTSAKPGKSNAANLPVKARPATRIVALRGPSV